jgi:hypothetical protein
MICEDIQEELVAYCDGELPEEDRAQIAAHLSTCSACSRDVTQFTRINRLFSQQVERVTLSPDFATTFWQRLEQEKQMPVVQESRFSRWWREWRESLTSWNLTPALVGAASIVVFFGYILSDRGPTTPDPIPKTGSGKSAPQTLVQTPTPAVPKLVQEKAALFVNYRVLTDLEKFSRFEEIASVQLPNDPPLGIAENDIPQDLLEKPSFFTNYPMLRKMDELENLETVLDAPLDGEDKSRG